MFGDYLRNNIYLLKDTSKNKKAKDAFWIVLRDIAIKDILLIYPNKVDSDIAIPIYYKILKANLNYIPEYYQEIIKSNNQERFRVLNRNMWVTNAFHKDGLANQKEVIAYSQLNEYKKGNKIVYQGVKEHVN